MKTINFFLFLFVFLVISTQQIFAQYPYSILIDPGHGGSNLGVTGWDGVNEKIVTLQIADKLNNYLVFGVGQSGSIISSFNMYNQDSRYLKDIGNLLKQVIVSFLQN